MKYLSLVAMAIAVSSTAATAGTWTPVTDTREAIQALRIQSGRLTGSLTDREAARLQLEQDHIKALEKKIKADGVITERERERLREAQDRASRHIAKEKTDREHR